VILTQASHGRRKRNKYLVLAITVVCQTKIYHNINFYPFLMGDDLNIKCFDHLDLF
jgi:hypothetical protein